MPRGRRGQGCKPCREGRFRGMSNKTMSVVIPAFNEERYLPATLHAVARSTALLQCRNGVRTEVIVVDNCSTDATAKVAASFETQVVTEPEHNIAGVRNRGAAVASGSPFAPDPPLRLPAYGG